MCQRQTKELNYSSFLERALLSIFVQVEDIEKKSDNLFMMQKKNQKTVKKNLTEFQKVLYIFTS